MQSAARTVKMAFLFLKQSRHFLLYADQKIPFEINRKISLVKNGFKNRREIYSTLFQFSAQYTKNF